jgi:hypothetical protein
MVDGRVARLKENRRRIALLACCTLMCLEVGGRARAAEAPPSLLVLEDPGAPQPRLLAALRIQLGAAVRVDVRSAPRAGALPEQLAEASRMAHDQARAAVMWVDAARGSPRAPRQALLYVVGQRDGRALVEVVSVPAERGPDLERVLALKVSELLTEMRSAPAHALAPPPTATEAAPPPMAAVTAAPPMAAVISPPMAAATPVAAPPPMAAEPAGSSWEAALALGPRLSTVLGASLTRFGVGALAGTAWSFGSVRAGIGLGLDWYPTARRERAGAALDVSELAPLVRAELTLRQALVDVRVHTGVALDSLSVSGRTALATAGRSPAALSLAWLVGAGLERALWQRLCLVGFAELAVQERRQYFAVNGEDALDLGRVRLTLGVELRLRLSP